MQREGLEQLELSGGQIDDHAIRPPQDPGRGIEFPALEADQVRPLTFRHPGRLLRAAQHRLDAGQQLPWIERLGQIVVRPHLEADDAVDLLAHRRQHDHRYLGTRAQLAAQGEPVGPRQHEIENDQVDAPVGKRLLHLPAVPGRGHAVAMPGQEAGHQVPDFPVVVDDKQVLGSLASHAGHRAKVASSGRSDARKV